MLELGTGAGVIMEGASEVTFDGTGTEDGSSSKSVLVGAMADSVALLGTGSKSEMSDSMGSRGLVDDSSASIELVVVVGETEDAGASTDVDSSTTGCEALALELPVSELASKIGAELASELASEVVSEVASEVGWELASELRSEVASDVGWEMVSELASELGVTMPVGAITMGEGLELVAAVVDKASLVSSSDEGGSAVGRRPLGKRPEGSRSLGKVKPLSVVVGALEVSSSSETSDAEEASDGGSSSLEEDDTGVGVGGAGGTRIVLEMIMVVTRRVGTSELGSEETTPFSDETEEALELCSCSSELKDCRRLVMKLGVLVVEVLSRGKAWGLVTVELANCRLT